MTIVFVHGVPETPAVWDVVRQRIDEETVAVHLPGFGIPRPPELRDNDAYATWLADQLRRVEGPIDLVAHDWGAHLAMRVVSAFDVPVRSWIVDNGEAIHPEYVWHEGAQIIQSPQGADFLAGLRRPNGSFDGFLVPRGINSATMAVIDEAADETMTGTMYDLYRDATPNLYHYRGWGPQFDKAANVPGLVIVPEDDPYGDPRLSRETAERLSARLAVLPGRSHYWMHQDPDAAVALMRTFWAEAGGPR
jgi:pimeloyl-ACP methyl ester carboxylesterase